jgi:hypothetical protein
MTTARKMTSMKDVAMAAVMAAPAWIAVTQCVLTTIMLGKNVQKSLISQNAFTVTRDANPATIFFQTVTTRIR